VRFNTLNRATGNRLKRKMVDSVTDEEVPTEEQVRGYAVGKDQFVTVEDDELAEIAIESSHTVDIDKFVPKASIDDRYRDTPYYLAPEDKVGPASWMVCATISGLSPKPFSRSTWTGRSTAAAITRALSSMTSRVARPTASGSPRVAIAPKLVVSISGTPTWASRQAVPTSQQAADRVGSAPAWSARHTLAFSFVLLINGTPGWQSWRDRPPDKASGCFPDRPSVS
jgi:hypothetical protein